MFKESEKAMERLGIEKLDGVCVWLVLITGTTGEEGRCSATSPAHIVPGQGRGKKNRIVLTAPMAF